MRPTLAFDLGDGEPCRELDSDPEQQKRDQCFLVIGVDSVLSKVKNSVLYNAQRDRLISDCFHSLGRRHSSMRNTVMVDSNR